MSMLPTRWTSYDYNPLFRLLDDYDVSRNKSSPSSIRAFAPKFDVKEADDAYDLEGELPGVDKKDVHLEFADPHTLTVKGELENKVEKEEQDHGVKYWVSERSRGEFHRTFNFPQRVDQNHVKASMNNGVLSVHVPKTSGPTSKTITID